MVEKQASKKRVLFISHDASRSGAPIVLLQLLKWLREYSHLEFEVALAKGGELADEFQSVAPLSPLNREIGWARLLGAARRRLRYSPLRRMLVFDLALQLGEFLLRVLFRLRHRRCPYDLIYANTASNGAALRLLSHWKCPVVTHVHELENALQLMQPNVAQVFRRSAHYIAVAEVVKRNLVENYGIASQQIDVVNGWVAADALRENSDARKSIRHELRIPEDAILVTASGSLEPRKGADLFIQVANKILGRDASTYIHFLWLGGDLQSAFYQQIKQNMAQMPLRERIHFIGSRPNPLDYFAASDIFVLPSREDPFPLVCLEAASQGVPVICFADAGGIPEFVEDDCGFVAPYLDVKIMAERVLQLLEDDDLRQQLGQNAAQKVRQRHDLSVVAPQILKVIQRLL